MDGLPVYYVMQPSEDDSINVFFLPPTLKALSDVKIRDVVTNFPHAGNGKFYHFRFHTICDKDQKSWVDISNLNARAPAVDNKIYVKILEISQPHHSKIFAAHYGAAPQNSRPPVHTSQNTREEHRSHDILNNAPQRSHPEPQTQGYKKSVSSGDKPTPNPNTVPQQRPMTQSQPKPAPHTQQNQSSAHDFDLLGGGDAPAENVTIKSTSTTTKTTVSFSGGNQQQQEEKSELYGMTREELGAYKQQKMEEAIQDKLNFANNLWQGEEQSRLGKEKAYNEVEDAIRKWSGNTGTTQRNNIRALLCTVHQVIWQDCDWKALGLSDLMTPAQIKKNYFKAITKFHPDKNQHGDYKQKYIAERVTNELNIAWDEFRKTNP